MQDVQTIKSHERMNKYYERYLRRNKEDLITKTVLIAKTYRNEFVVPNAILNIRMKSTILGVLNKFLKR